MMPRSSTAPEAAARPDRRAVLAGGAVAFGLLAMRPRGNWADDPPKDGPRPDASDRLPIPGKDLKAHTVEPPNGEPDLAALVAAEITPRSLFYVRSHGPTPTVDAATYRLAVDGLVESPREFSLDELKSSFPNLDVTATLTCAGGRRAEMAKEKPIGGVPWGPGAIGNAVWTGVDLAAVLASLKMKPEAKHVVLTGLDAITEGDGPPFPFGASFPRERLERPAAGPDAKPEGATPPGAILAWAMNGEPLPPEHGGPLRVVVPGLIGARSVKWVGRVTASATPSDNHYMVDAYKLVPEAKPEAFAAAPPLMQFTVNAAGVAAKRPEGAGTEASPRSAVELRGYALPVGGPGRTPVRVELSTDDGSTWIAAAWTTPARPFCWRLWRAELDLPPGTARVFVRAVDSGGAIMPRKAPWNAKGYMENGWYSVRLTA